MAAYHVDVVQEEEVATGETVTIRMAQVLLWSPVPLATLTLRLPDNSSGINRVDISTQSVITAISWINGTVLGLGGTAISSALAGQTISVVWSELQQEWVTL